MAERRAHVHLPLCQPLERVLGPVEAIERSAAGRQNKEIADQPCYEDG